MSKPDRTVVLAAQVDAAVADLDRALRRRHVARGDRRALVDEVHSDLQSAARDGVSPQVLIGPDVDAFARAALEAGGSPQLRDYRRVVVGGALAAVSAVIAAHLLIIVVVGPVLAGRFDLDSHHPTAGPVVVNGAVAVAGLLGVLAALHSLLGGRAGARETLIRAALLTPIGAATGVAAAAAVARNPDYTTTEATVVGQVLLVLLPVLAALGAARWWALRSSTDGGDGSAGPHPDLT